MYQQSMSIGYMIDDMHSMITGASDSGMKYLFKLNRKSIAQKDKKRSYNMEKPEK